MNPSMFQKMKAKPPCTARVFYAPPGYPEWDELGWPDAGQADFVHLFVENREQFPARFSTALEAYKDDGLFWVSYPKSRGKLKFDINRDSLWQLLLAEGFHPVSQVALDEEWSAVRVKRNEAGVTYELPGNVKR